jgi:hypothetical protein
MYTLEYDVMMLEVISFFQEFLPLFLPTFGCTMLMVRPFWTVVATVEQFGNGH